LAEDFRRVHDEPGATPDMQKQVVGDIEFLLNEMGWSLSDYIHVQHLLHVPSNGIQRSIVDKKVHNNEERESFLLGLFDHYCSQMNQGQCEAMERLENAYDNNK
jgi:hypothetical protein